MPDVAEHDWQAVLDAVSGRWPISYEVDGSPRPPPDAPSLRAALTGREQTHLLRVAVTPLININTHFFSVDEIEFDFDPREVLDDDDLAAVLDFMRLIGRTLRKPVFANIESSPPRPSPELRYDPTDDDVIALL